MHYNTHIIYDFYGNVKAALARGNYEIPEGISKYVYNGTNVQ